MPNSDAVNHWLGEIIGFRSDALQAYEPPMRRIIDPDLPKIYERAKEQAEVALAATGSPLPPDCPFSLDELLDEKTPPSTYVERIRADCKGISGSL